MTGKKKPPREVEIDQLTRADLDFYRRQAQNGPLVGPGMYPADRKAVTMARMPGRETAVPARIVEDGVPLTIRQVVDRLEAKFQGADRADLADPGEEEAR